MTFIDVSPETRRRAVAMWYRLLLDAANEQYETPESKGVTMSDGR
jgi:hypothetical protein